MEKTKLGITAGFFGAVLYLFGLVGGYVITGLAVAYILLKEENSWLKKQSVRVVALMLIFSLAYAVIGLLPDFFGIISSVIGLNGAYLSFSFIDRVHNILYYILNIAKVVLFVLLALGALNQAEGKLPVIDDLIDKYVR